MPMILPFRNSLIILIALLQLVAPLVHAHSSESLPQNLGIHLPGLEFIAGNQNLPGAHTEASRIDCCGILIDVGCGVQHSKTAMEMPVALNSRQNFTLPNIKFIVATINFSPHRPSIFSTASYLQPVSPRAPPSLPLFI